MRSLASFVTGFLGCSVISIGIAIFSSVGPIAIWPVSAFVTAKMPSQSISLEAQISREQYRDYWQKVAIFAEENGFSMVLPPFDHGPGSRVNALLRRGDNINLNFSRSNNIVHVLISSEEDNEISIVELRSNILSNMAGFSFIEMYKDVPKMR